MVDTAFKNITNLGIQLNDSQFKQSSHLLISLHIYLRNESSPRKLSQLNFVIMNG